VDDISEKEQLEQMRAWWSEYGNYVIGGVVVGIAIMVGVGQYRSYTVQKQTEASGLYETVFEAVADGNLDAAESAAADLFADYGSTVYPAQARLALARLYMDKGRDQDAATALRAVVDAEPDSEMGLVARLRLAKVLIYQNDAAGVVDLLDDVEAGAFTARYSEALGDAYVMLGNYADARDAYLVAMSDNAARPTVDRAMIQMKLDDLPDASAATEAGAQTPVESQDAAPTEPAGQPADDDQGEGADAAAEAEPEEPAE